MRTLFATTATLALVLSAAQASFGAQARGRAGNSAARPASNATAAARRAQATRAFPLPASDVVLAVDLARLFGEGMTRALAGQPERAAQVAADVEQFKARTGIDPRAFDTLTAGGRIVKTPSGAAKLDHLVAVASGRFDVEAVAAAARRAPNARLTEQKHGGRTVYVLAVGDQLRLFGLLKMRVGELAFAALDAGTLAVGEPAAVRAAIDAAGGSGRVSAALLDGARIGGDALIAFAGNVPAGTFAGVDVGLPNINRSIEAIRGFYGNVGMTAAGYQLTTALRTESAADARQLGDTVQALKAIAPGFINVAGDRYKFAGRIVESLNITTRSNEVHLRLDLSQDDLGQLLRVL
ncbi:MAG TPA: hypothetical protein VEY09_00420 [Pyrinomonadaceae bacterium]|nr:hypothetical protein [Pyrinomonadaceae bacterium]